MSILKLQNSVNIETSKLLVDNQNQLISKLSMDKNLNFFQSKFECFHHCCYNVLPCFTNPRHLAAVIRSWWNSRKANVGTSKDKSWTNMTVSSSRRVHLMNFCHIGFCVTFLFLFRNIFFLFDIVSAWTMTLFQNCDKAEKFVF